MVTIQNTTAKAIDKLRVELWAGSRLVTVKNGSVVSPGQSTVFQLATATPDQSYVVVTADSGKTTDEVAVAPEITPKPESTPKAASPGPSALLVGVVSSLLSLLAVVIGTILTQVITSRREQRSRSFEARRSDTERYSAAYREFLEYWRAGTSYSQLENGFESLRGKAFIPSDIQALYETTRAILRDATSSQQSKTEAAQRLYAALDALTVTKTGKR